MAGEAGSAGKTLEVSHRFLDEAGDTTFFDKNRVVSIGSPGVSLAFGIGMVKFSADLKTTRRDVLDLQRAVEADEYLNRIPSVAKRIANGGFYFHATADPPEVRERLFRYIRTMECSLEMVVGRKIPSLYAKKHNNRESEFYADLLSHLLKNKLRLGQRLVLNVAARGTTTRNANLDRALAKATDRFSKRWDRSEIHSQVVFNVQTPRLEPLLAIADYLCWSVQRVFEKGELRHYEYVKDRIALVIDLYDFEKYEGSRNYYKKGNLLTTANKLSPPSS
ncbi:MAG: hypothetical protein HY706_03965 [Candidatus Hydrogenedentes bacterium]|nr:hypothetical protein [Candidatus Hydrogenedentota bacterium]